MTGYLIAYLVIIGALILGLCACWYFLWRNNRVYDLRRLIAHEVHVGSIDDIEAERDWRWRWAVLDTVSYDKMLYSVKRLRASSFYSDRSFINYKDTSL